MPDSIVWLFERTGVLLLIIAFGFAIGAAFSRAPPVRLGFAAAIAILSLIPVGGISGFTLVFSVLGPLSVATILGLGLSLGLSLRVFTEAARQDLRAAAAVVAVLGIVLYPGAIGLLPWDTYRLGFQGATLPAALIVIAFAAAAAGLLVVPLWIAVAAIAWQASLFASLNLWDYLIDPLAWLASLVLLVVVTARTWRRSVRVIGSGIPENS
jgi:hypothetical protein